MAHAITTRANGKAEMAYVGDKPWHGLGEELPEGQTIEQWMVAAGMDWKVQRAKVRYATEREQAGNDFAEWPEQHVLMRSDSKAPLAIVSDKFEIVQPREILEFFRDLTEAAGFKLQTAGTLHGGRKFWALASIGAQDAIIGNDLVKGNLLLATAADGTMKTTAKNVTERVVCANTLAIAMSEKGAPSVAVSHRSEFDAAAVKRQLGATVRNFEQFIVDARALANRTVSSVEAQAFVAKLLGEAEGSEDFAGLLRGKARINNEQVAKRSRNYTGILELFNGAGIGANMEGSRGTAWGLVNSVTEWQDRHVRAVNDGNRLDSAWFGAGDDLKQDAMAQAMALVA